LRSALDYIFLYLKGLCIGATGVLHGISGGSMALLLGVHHDFILALDSLDGDAYRLLKQKKISAFWQKINGNFLVCLMAGIVTGLLTLRTLFSYYLSQYPLLISSFFFSLVIVAALLLLRKIRRWNAGVALAVICGLMLSYFITRSELFNTPDTLFLAFAAGVLSGSSLVLPGVSAAFILIFIGKYQYILASFVTLKLDVVILFLTGGIVGLTLVARLIARLLAKYYNAIVALFAGLMIGSLNKIWPWREVVEYATTIEGHRIPAFDKSILPWRYFEVTGKDPQVFYAILMMAAGVFMVVLIEKITARLKTRI
jgi:putative membrane protein